MALGDEWPLPWPGGAGYKGPTHQHNRLVTSWLDQRPPCNTPPEHDTVSPASKTNFAFILPFQAQTLMLRLQEADKNDTVH